MIKNTGTQPSQKIARQSVIGRSLVVSPVNNFYIENTGAISGLSAINQRPLAWLLSGRCYLRTVEYDINDYNWGMSSYGLPPGSQFDLVFTWKREGKSFEGRIDNVSCPDDIHPEPAA